MEDSVKRHWVLSLGIAAICGAGSALLWGWFRNKPSEKATEKRKGKHSVEPPWIIWGKESNCHRVRQEHFQNGTRWLRFGKVFYSNGKQPELASYEMVERIPHRAIDGVDVIAIVKRRGRASKLLFVLNYRPPVDQVCLEFPSGLLDENETPDQAAVRELKEETGFTASRILGRSPVGYCDPWKSNETYMAICAEVDGDDPANLDTTQKLEHDENIQVLMVSLEKTLFDGDDDKQEYDQSEESQRRRAAAKRQSSTPVFSASGKIVVGNAADSGFATPLANTIMTLCHSKGFAIEGKVLSFIEGLEFGGMFSSTVAL